MIEIKHLKTLDSLAKTHSLSKSAQALYMTDSALSHQIKELEKRIGGILFERKTTPIKFTDRGQTLLELAEKVLPLVQQTQQILLNEELNQLRIAVECHACFSWLMPVIQEFKQQWPEFNINFSTETILSSFDALHKQQADIVFTSDKQNAKELTFIPIGEFEMRLITAPSHRLAKQNHVTPQDLVHECLLTYPIEPNRLDIFRLFLHPAKVKPKQIRTVEQANVLIQMVSADMGVAALPTWATHQFEQQKLISSTAIGQQGIHRQLYGAIRSSDQNQSKLQQFIEQAQWVIENSNKQKSSKKSNRR